MITRLYIEMCQPGVYDVVCNDLYTVASPVENLNGNMFLGIETAIEVLTAAHRDECEYTDDMAGVRVGYMPFDMLGAMYGGVDRIVPAGELAQTIRQLTAVDA